MVRPGVGLALTVKEGVNRFLHGLRSHRWNESYLGRHVLRGLLELSARYNTVDHAGTLGFLGRQNSGTQKELFCPPSTEFPRLDKEFNSNSSHSKNRIRKCCILGSNDQVAHAGKHESSR
ncbi:unannotated protein [freshwater metagenome]|uniref:Unannotated protein n=1 Tax=freshwater metagenome TaxID=449393 RepID=A0A6J6ZA10_9ZZZZ